VIDALRTIKRFVYRTSSVEIFGIHIDVVLHFIVAFGLVVLLAKFLSAKKSVIIALALVALKELADVFLKSRIEYIRPPTIDALVDIGFGILGITLGMCFLNLQQKRESRRVQNRLE
jgi:hypothetical protein